VSFFFAIVYLIVEYIRPQQMYDVLSGLPFAQIAILGMFISFILEGRRPNNFNFQNILMLAFLFWVFISYLYAYKPDLAWQSLVDFAKWVVIYFLLINIINDRNKLYVFTVVLLLLMFKQTQYMIRNLVQSGFHVPKTGLYAGAGFFANPGDLGAALACVFGVAYYLIRADTRKMFNWFKMQWFHIACAASIPLAIFATNSRGAALAWVMCLLGLWYKSRVKMRSALGIVGVVLAFSLLMTEENFARFKASGTEADVTGQERIELWKAGLRMVNENPLTGVGPNNFVYVNTANFSSEYKLVQHNIWIQAGSELGYPGLGLLLMMIAGCFYNQKRVRTLLKEKQIEDPLLYWLSHGLDIGLIGFIVSGLFASTLCYPFFWINLVLSVALLDIVKRMADGHDIDHFKAMPTSTLRRP
jgi:O-antigen ligase